jgi:hypothetical protein
MTLGPEYFLDKVPSKETAEAATNAKNKGYKIMYPEVFLRRFNAPLAPQVQPEIKVEIDDNQKQKLGK